MDNCLTTKNHCMTIESNVSHQYEFYLERLSRISIFWSSREKGGLKSNFRWRSQQVCLRSLHCDVECFDLSLWKRAFIGLSLLPNQIHVIWVKYCLNKKTKQIVFAIANTNTKTMPVIYISCQYFIADHQL